MIRNAVEFVHHVLKEKVQQASFLVDATCGNGHDTQYLVENASPQARILAMDIQQLAIDNTRRRLLSAGVLSEQITIVKDTHENIGQYLTTVDVALFNLGYLPAGDHQITTKAQTTVDALAHLLPLMSAGGLVACVAYPGHSPGVIEMEQLELLLGQLPQSEYHAGYFKLLNQVNQPPVLYLIEKIRSETCEGIAPRQD